MLRLTEIIIGFIIGFFALLVGWFLWLLVANMLIAVITPVIGLLVWCILAWTRGQTPAKQLLGMRTVSLSQGKAAGFATMIFREIIAKPLIAAIASLVVIGVILDFWLLWDKDTQELWDKVSDTVIVNDRSGVTVPFVISKTDLAALVVCVGFFAIILPIIALFFFRQRIVGVIENPTVLCTPESAKTAARAITDTSVGCTTPIAICQAPSGVLARRMILSFNCGSGGVLYWYVFSAGSENIWKLSWKPSDELTGLPHASLKVSSKNPNDLILTEPIYLDGDPDCCPTGGTRDYMLRWQGKEFVVASTTTKRGS